MSTVTSKPEGTIETSIGTVRFHMTNATHVYLYTEQPAEKVTIRQIPYKLNYHCYLQNEQWDRNANDLNAWAEPGLSRQVSLGGQRPEVPGGGDPILALIGRQSFIEAGMGRHADQQKDGEAQTPSHQPFGATYEAGSGGGGDKHRTALFGGREVSIPLP